jgi:hypothetical protein
MAVRTPLAVVLAWAVACGPACREDTATDSTPTLEIRCSANPTSGPAPLTVAFGLDVAGAVGTFSVAIQYGDGSQGTDPGVRHVYAAAGEYMASLTVSAGVETARCSLPISVAPAPAPTPTPRAGNQQPQVRFKTNPATGAVLTGTAPFTVYYNMCMTVDPEGDELLFKMDLDGDGNFEFHGSTGADCRNDVTYAVGTRTATQCVTDVHCPSWPLCQDYPPIHPFQCRSYTVTALP